MNPASSTTAQMATLSKLVAAAQAKGIALPPGAAMLAGGAPSAAGAGAGGSGIQITSVAEGQAVLAKLQAALVASQGGGGSGGAGLGGAGGPDLAALLGGGGGGGASDLAALLGGGGGSGDAPELRGGSDKDKLLAMLSAAAKEQGSDEDTDEVDEDADTGGGGSAKRSSGGGPRAAEPQPGMSTIDTANAFLDAGVPDEIPGLPDNSGGASKDHVIARGESLKTIADMYGTTMEKLARVNNLTDLDDIQPGMYLQVPNYA